MSTYFAFTIEGLRNPEDPNSAAPVLFVYGDTTALSLPASLIGSDVLPWLESSDPGLDWNGDLRKPIGSGGSPAIRLIDTSDSALGKILLFDPTETTWDIRDAVIEEGQTTIIVSGPATAPALGFYWIEEECVQVEAVAAVPMGGANSVISFSLTIARGACGSRDQVHMVSTANFGPTDQGQEEFLTLWQRPNLGAFRFRATCYFLSSPFSASPAEIIDARHFFVDEEPLAGIPSFEIKLRDVAEVMEAFTFQIGTMTSLAFRLLVLSEGTETTTTEATSGSVTTVRKLPNECVLYLDRLRAAMLFGEPLSQPGQNGFDAALVIGLRTRLTANPDIGYFIKLTTRESEWLFSVTNVLLSPIAASAGVIPIIECHLTLRDYPKGQSIDQEPDQSNQQTGDQTIIDTYPNTAFSREAPLFGIMGLLVPQEEPPTLELWYGLSCNPVDAYLYLTTSNGGFSADPYDAIIGKGLGIPSDWQNRGTPSVSPLGTRWDTLELLQLRQLLDAEYTYYVKSGQKLGEFLTNLCLLHTLMHGAKSTGEFFLRRWARPLESEAILGLNPSIEDLTSPGTRLTPVRAMLLYSGIKLLTLEPEFVRSVSLGGVAYRESGEPLSIRVWQPGNALTNDLLQQGQLGHLLRAFFSTMGGAPVRLSITTSVLDRNFELGDFVYVTNDRIPTPQGRGMVAVRHIIVGAELNFRTGKKTYRLLRDYYNELPQTTGQISPTLAPSPPLIDGPNFEIPADSIGDPGFGDPDIEHGGVWGSILDDIGFIHILSPDIHNPTDQDDREGWGEVYGQVVGLIKDLGTKRGRLVVQFDAAWSRSGITPESLLSSGNAIITLVDRRPPSSNPQGALIEPGAAQLATGEDFLTYAGPSNNFQRNFSKVG